MHDVRRRRPTLLQRKLLHRQQCHMWRHGKLRSLRWQRSEVLHWFDVLQRIQLQRRQLLGLRRQRSGVLQQRHGVHNGARMWCR